MKIPNPNNPNPFVGKAEVGAKRKKQTPMTKCSKRLEYCDFGNLNLIGIWDFGNWDLYS